MTMTARTELQLKPEELPFMERRFCSFSFKSPQNPKKRVTVCFGFYPMDCIVWAAERVHDDVERNNSDDDAEENCSQLMGECLFPECDKEALRACQCKNRPLKYSWKMDCLHFFYTSQATYAMNENGLYFNRFAFLIFSGIFFVDTPKTTQTGN